MILRHSGMRLLAQASDAQLRIGESILLIAVMDSGFEAAPHPGMTIGWMPYSSPCTFGMSWVGAICGAGLAWTWA